MVSLIKVAPDTRTLISQREARHTISGEQRLTLSGELRVVH